MKQRRAVFNDDFWHDLLDAADWYDEQEPGVGYLSRDEVLATTHLVAQKAEAYRRVHGPYRRALVSRFRHMVIFIIDGQQVLFVAVVHGMRDLPRWLTRRLDDE